MDTLPGLTISRRDPLPAYGVFEVDGKPTFKTHISVGGRILTDDGSILQMAVTNLHINKESITLPINAAGGVYCMCSDDIPGENATFTPMFVDQLVGTFSDPAKIEAAFQPFQNYDQLALPVEFNDSFGAPVVLPKASVPLLLGLQGDYSRLGFGVPNYRRFIIGGKEPLVPPLGGNLANVNVCVADLFARTDDAKVLLKVSLTQAANDINVSPPYPVYHELSVNSLEDGFSLFLFDDSRSPLQFKGSNYAFVEILLRAKGSV